MSDRPPRFKEIKAEVDGTYVNRLEEAMLDAGISKKSDLARVVGVRYEAITKGMRTGSLMNIQTALRIADALEIPLDDLFGVPVDQVPDMKPPKKFSRTIPRSQMLEARKRRDATPRKRRRILRPPKEKNDV